MNGGFQERMTEMAWKDKSKNEFSKQTGVKS
jgi:hypothetical protein